MKKIGSYSVVLIIGILLGGTYTWVASHLGGYDHSKVHIRLEEVLKYSNTQIQSANFSCEGGTRRTVGAVVGSIYDVNNQNVRNMVSFGCFDHTCVLSISNCKPWQTQECGSRHLKFQVNPEREIDPATFTCIDVP